MNVRAAVLDFDGVVLQSVDVKTRAFETLFAGERPEARARIVAYHVDNGGISRFEKFRWAYREVLKRPLSGGEERALGEKFNRLVEDAVVGAAWVPGAREFLEGPPKGLPLFVASGTPEEELKRIVERRGLGRFFKGVFGSPPRKVDILRSVADKLACPARELVMVGDSRNDWDAAREAGTLFIGIAASGAPNPFPPDVRVLEDLRKMGAELAS